MMHLCFGLALILFSSQHKTMRGIREIGTAEVLIGLGCVLVAVRGSIPDLVSIVVANVSIYVAVMLICFGILRFFHANDRFLFFASVPLIAVCAAGVVQSTGQRFCWYAGRYPGTDFHQLTFVLVDGGGGVDCNYTHARSIDHAYASRSADGGIQPTGNGRAPETGDGPL